MARPKYHGILRMTPEALAAALGLPPGIRVLHVQQEREWTTMPNDVLVMLEDVEGARLPLVPEGCVMPVVSIDQVRDALPAGARGGS